MAPASQSPPSRLRNERLERPEGRIKRRVRTRQACESCRRRRRKCNGRLPCAQCIGYSYPCQYLAGAPDKFEEQTSRVQNDDSETADLNQLHVGTHEAAEASGSVQLSQQSNNDGDEKGPQNHEIRSAKFRPTVDTVKGRYSNAHSSILLPRRLGRTMNLSKHIRFHSYGW